jgi:hypothetical protein
MSKLEELQKKMFSALIEDEYIDTTIFKKNASLSSEQGLSIYRNSLNTTLLNALREVYPVCNKLTGDNFFNAMAMIYIKKTPSHSKNIGHYGGTFPHFIADFPHTKSLPYLSDVAHLEWAWHKALHAKNTTPFYPETLMELSEEDHAYLVFHLPPSAILITSDYPINDIWQVNQKEYEDEPTVDLDKGGVKLLVWRQNMDMHLDVLQENEWALLSALQQGVPMGELDEALNEAQVTQLSEMLADCVKRGWIAGYKIMRDC